MQVQFNGRIPAFQAGYAGSIPATCSKKKAYDTNHKLFFHYYSPKIAIDFIYVNMI